MSTLTDWAKHHQLTSFFVLNFSISWGLLISLGPLYANGVVIVVPALMLALFGPALAGVILSGVIHPEPRQAAPRNRLLAFFLTWLVATPAFVFSPGLSRQGIGISSGLVVKENPVLALAACEHLADPFGEVGRRNAIVVEPGGTVVEQPWQRN